MSRRVKSPAGLQFCPRTCPSLVNKGNMADRCRRGFWRASDPFKAPLFYAQYEVREHRQHLVSLFVVRAPECDYKGGK